MEIHINTGNGMENKTTLEAWADGEIRRTLGRFSNDAMQPVPNGYGFSLSADGSRVVDPDGGLRAQRHAAALPVGGDKGPGVASRAGEGADERL